MTVATNLSVPDVRPPRSWELRTTTVLGAVAACALLNLLYLVCEGFALLYLLNHRSGGLPSFVVGFARNADGFSFLLLVISLAYIWGFVQWSKSTGQMLGNVGDPSTVASTHWSILAWRLSFIIPIAISFERFQSAGDSDPLSTRLVYDMIQSGCRVVGLVLLLIGVWQIRAEVRERVAACGVTLRFDRDARESAIAAQASAEWTAAPALAADDDFWNSVRDLARATNADLPLLEAAGPFAHRWLLVPASGDVTAVRADLAPGARITLFAQPPTTGFSAPDGPGPFHGYLDGNYRGVTAQRVPAFLSQAANAARWGLYAANDPIALHGTV